MRFVGGNINNTMSIPTNILITVTGVFNKVIYVVGRYRRREKSSSFVLFFCHQIMVAFQLNSGSSPTLFKKSNCITHNIQLNTVIPQYLEAQRNTEMAESSLHNQVKTFHVLFQHKQAIYLISRLYKQLIQFVKIYSIMVKSYISLFELP